MPLLIALLFLTVGILAATRIAAWWRGNEWRRAARRAAGAHSGRGR